MKSKLQSLAWIACMLVWCISALGAPLLAVMQMPMDGPAGAYVWPLFGWVVTVLITSFLFANVLRDTERGTASIPFYCVFIGLWVGGMVFPVLLAMAWGLVFG